MTTLIERLRELSAEWNRRNSHINCTVQQTVHTLFALNEAAAEIERLQAKVDRYESRLELVSYTDGNGTAHIMTEAEKISFPDGIECRDETINLLDEKVERLQREVVEMREAIHATDHRLKCTNSNEPGQKGSRYA